MMQGNRNKNPMRVHDVGGGSNHQALADDHSAEILSLDSVRSSYEVITHLL